MAGEACEKICHAGKRSMFAGGDMGVFLPSALENEWPQEYRWPMYFVFLLYCFLGVAIVADVFMAAIEKVTSKKRRIFNAKTKKHSTVTVWNPTVANLTLMALGSSAPEILLSVIELFTGKMRSGDLGPSTIVGSAAFNLFCITAVCIVAIPDGEVRKIKEVPVFIITAFFSVFAYIWLVLMLMYISPNVVEIWEGVLTFMLFPILIMLAFAADKGYFSSAEAAFGKQKTLMGLISMGPDMTESEVAQVATRVRQSHGVALNDEQIARLIASEMAPKPTRAQRRIGATRNIVGGKKVPVSAATGAVVSAKDSTSDDQASVKKEVETQLGFSSLRFAVLENVGVAKLPVFRCGDLKREVSLRCESRDGTAKKGEDYELVDQVLHFLPGETEKFITVKIIDDAAYEDDEEFFVELVDAVCDKGGVALLSDKTSATVVIIDDDEPGVLRFEKECVEMEEGLEDFNVTLVIHRVNGCTGCVGCEYTTEDGTAIAGADYEPAKGTLTLEHGQMSAVVTVSVKARGRFEHDENFRVILSEPFGDCKFDQSTDGGEETCVCTIIVKPNVQAKDQVEFVMSHMRVNWDKLQLGHTNWKSQFVAAVSLNGGGEDDEDDDGEQAGIVETVLHILTVPWKLVFALVPPVDYMDGWVCFFCALVMIGLVTALIGDVAALLGCCMGLEDAITAITFVALGTSLPDTFASKAAAVGDPTADASIGNITGSNSVNVFLGLGLPWMMGAIYWQIKGPDADWIASYPDEAAAWSGQAVFVVKAGSLSFSVIVFTVCALTTLTLLFLRRKFCGGELGGPPAAKNLSAVFLVFLWLVYVGLSVWNITSGATC